LRLKRYYLFHKPHKVLCQFTSEGTSKTTLSHFLDVPADVYPLGRLDEDSEGLLLLSSERSLMKPYSEKGTEKEYWVQVEGMPKKEDLEALTRGIQLNIKGKPQVLRAKFAGIFEEARPKVAERDPPIRQRQHIPDCWLKIVLNEGKNRQIRRMTAAIGFPTLRLIRVRIGQISLAGLGLGEFMETDRNHFLKALG
jgi:23S rRNA pseudouridine2457 synthase